MSYILDALRKSEQDRQIAAGRGVGMLFPARIEHPAKSRAPLAGLAAAVLATAGALGWWAWPKVPQVAAPAERPPANAAMLPSMARLAPPVPAAAPAQISVPAPNPVQIAAAAPVTPPLVAQPPLAPATAVRKPAAPEAAARPPADPAPQKTAPPAPPAAARGDAAGEAPKGLPPMTISGYINDDGANLAIINDKLVREGEEIAPGLRLEKIVGESAVFNYKGQHFRR